MIRTKDSVFFDTDCLSAFLWVDEVDALFSLFSNKIVLPRSVYDEIICIHKFKIRIENFIRIGLVTIADLEYGSDEIKIFTALKKDKHYKKLGDGEAEVISLAVCNSKKMSSNNLSDVAQYVRFYNLYNYTVPDLLDSLIDAKIREESEVAEIWDRMLKRRIYLPAKSYYDYMEMKKVKKSQC